MPEYTENRMIRLDMLRTAQGLVSTLLSILERANTEPSDTTVGLVHSADAQLDAAACECSIDAAIREEETRLAPRQTANRETTAEERRRDEECTCRIDADEPARSCPIHRGA